MKSSKFLRPLILMTGLCLAVHAQDNPPPDDPDDYPYPPEEPCCPDSCSPIDSGDANGSGCKPCEETGSLFFSIGLGRTGFERKTDYFKASMTPTFIAPRPDLGSVFRTTSGRSHKVPKFEQVAANYRRNPLTARREFRLWLAQENIVGATYLPSILIADPEATAEKIEVSGVIRQVVTDDRLADIQSLSAVKSSLPSDIQAALPSTSEGFVVRTWFAWDKGTKIGGVYTLPSGIDPLSYVVYYNPDAPADNGRLNIIHRSKYSATAYKTISYCYHQDSATHDWTSQQREGLPSGTVFRQTFLDVTSWTSDKDFTRIRTVKEAALDPSGALGSLQTIEVTEENFDNIGGTSRMVQEVRGHGTSASRTTRYGYYSDPAESSTLGRLKWRSDPDGSFEYYTFTFDRLSSASAITKMTPWKGYKWNPSTHPGGPTSSSCKVEVTYVYPTQTTKNTSVPGGLVGVETEQWTTVSGFPAHIYRQHNGSAYQTTTTCYYPSTAAAHLANRIKWKELPDGTAEEYIYGTPDGFGNYTQTVEKGAGSRTGVTSGSRVVTTRNKHGLTTAESRWHFDGANEVELEAWSHDGLDFFGRPVKRVWNGDSIDYDQTVYGCCGISSFRDRRGIVTEYFQDDLRRVRKEVVTVGSRVVTTTRDFNGLVTTVRKAAGTLDVLVSKTWRLLNGELEKTHAPDENNDASPEETTYAYSYPGTGGMIVTVTSPDGGTKVTEYYVDGRVKSVTGTAVPDVLYDYGRHSSGLWTQVTRPSAASPTGEWVKTYTDRSGRTFRAEYPSQIKVSGTNDFSLVTFYSQTAALGSRGRPYQATDPDGVVKTYGYDSEGDLSSLTETMPNGVGNRVTTFTHEADDTTVLGVAMIYTTKVNGVEVSTRIESGDGYSSQETSLGRTTTSERSIGAAGDWTETTTKPDGTRTVMIYDDGELEAVENRDNTTGSGALVSSTTYSYDAIGRTSSSTDSRTGVTNYTSYTESGNLLSEADSGSRVTSYGYDSRGRRIWVDAPDTADAASSTIQNITRTSYWPAGQVKAVWGDQAYTKVHLYDEQNRMLELRTFRAWAHTNGTSGPTESTSGYDETKWTYHTQRGWLSTKRDDANLGADYSYTAAGRLASRMWARTLPSSSTRLLTEYGYDSGKLVSVTYNDTVTPDLEYTYDSFGRLDTVERGGVLHADYGYHATTLRLETERLQADELDRTITRSYDAIGRQDKIEVGTPVDPDLDFMVDYDFDPAGRISRIEAGGKTLDYGFKVNSSRLVEGVYGPNGLVLSNTWESTRDLLSVKVNDFYGVKTSEFTYSVNALGQRTSVETDGAAFSNMDRGWSWGYDALGQVAKGIHSADPLFQSKGYNYDSIGNRTNTTQGTSPVMLNFNYTPNDLNQYSEYEWTGTPVSPVYDADGNMTADAGFNSLGYGLKFEWDCENRLVVARKADNTLVATYAYDHLGRRIRKTTTGAAYGGAKDIGYLYDGWNVVTDYKISSGSSFALEQAYTWGLDLSGSLQGAGGIGALLCIHVDPNTDGSGNRTWSNGFYPTYDGNGNVSEYLDNASGTEAAHYEYDPFGRIISSSGPYAASFEYRFSTKPLDVETGLYYYGYRHYDPLTGRWLNRDPLNETGHEIMKKSSAYLFLSGGQSISAYLFSENRPLSYIDILGEGFMDWLKAAWEGLTRQVTGSEFADASIPASGAVAVEIVSRSELLEELDEDSSRGDDYTPYDENGEDKCDKAYKQYEDISDAVNNLTDGL